MSEGACVCVRVCVLTPLEVGLSPRDTRSSATDILLGNELHKITVQCSKCSTTRSPYSTLHPDPVV